MKLLILSTKYPSPNFPMSGSNKSEFGLALKQKGVDIEILVPIPIQIAIKNGLSVGRDEKYNGIKTFHPWFIKIPFGSSYFSKFQGFLFRASIKKHLLRYKKSGGKLIQSHSISLAGASANYYKKWGFISIVTLHDNEVHDIKYRPKSYLRFIEKEINKSNQLLCVSQQQLLNMKRCMKINVPNEVIPYGIKKQEVSKKILPTLFTISIVCRLIKNKGVDILIKALAIINNKQKKQIKLIIVGTGNYEMNLKKLVEELNQNSNIIFNGEKPNHEIPGIISDTHVFILPSFEEALGLVYFEAMSVKTPIVGIIGQGIADYIIHGENGYLAPPKDVSALVDIIETLLKNPSHLKKVGENGFQVFEKSNVEWSKNAEKHLEIYYRFLKV